MTQPENKKKLTKLNEMFGDITEPIVAQSNNIRVDLLVPYKDHPFKPYTGQRFDDMVQSIKDHGVIQPVIIRSLPNSERSEILAGHNRWRAAQAAGLMEIPYIRMDGLTEVEAKLIVTETNLIQRSFSDLLHSERAYVLAQHYAALKMQGKRNDLIEEVKRLLNADEIRNEENGAPVEHRLKSRDVIAQNYDISRATVARYLRINELYDDLKKWIDEESISIRAGVELSYLSEDNQVYLVDILNNNKIKIDIKLACDLRDMEKAGKLNEKSIFQVLFGVYKKPKKEVSVLKGFKVKPNLMKKYFKEEQNPKDVEEIIDKALSMYFQANN